MSARAKFHMHTLGCKVNRAESETIAAALFNAGWQQSSAQQADVIIINTCTVTGEADHKNRKLIRSMLRSSDAQVLVTGCAININADFYADISNRVVCESDKTRIVEIAHRLIEANGERSVDDAPNASYEPSNFGIIVGSSSSTDILAKSVANSETDLFDLSSLGSLTRSGDGFRTRVDIKIQDGCNNACTFCIVHVARGKARSVPAEQVLEQVRTIASEGTREIVLVGIDIGAYQDGTIRLPQLLDMLLDGTPIKRIRISSVEPQSMNDAFIDSLATQQGRICRHLHLCMQSGSTKVLKEMARNYSADDFATLVDSVKSRVPEIALSTDVIVGFPGETEEDFQQTYRMIVRCGFMRLHVFRYSKRPGTPAAERTDQVPAQVIAERANRLHKLGKELARKDMEQRIGTSEYVLVEKPGIATSESYHTVLVDKELPLGSLQLVTFSDIDDAKSALTT